MQLYNAAGTDATGPYVQYNAPLNPGQEVTFVLEFYVPDRGSFTDTFQAEAILPAASSPFPAVLPSAVHLRIPASRVRRVVIEFATVPGQTYTVIYSDDGMVTWLVATPSITATATVTQWYAWPPETISSPFSGGSRFYRVIAGP